jgi:hypothetical protein
LTKLRLDSTIPAQSDPYIQVLEVRHETQGRFTFCVHC